MRYLTLKALNDTMGKLCGHVTLFPVSTKALRERFEDVKEGPFTSARQCAAMGHELANYSLPDSPDSPR